MEYIIWCDESTKNGNHYSDFYGGLLVRSTDLNYVTNSLLRAKDNSRFEQSEIKWGKVTSQYLNRYVDFTDVVFDLIKADKIKVRIMFRQSAHKFSSLSD